MALRRRPTDLRGRREDLGLTLYQLAAGVGLRANDLAEIERLETSDHRLEHHARWLDRIESWKGDERQAQFVRAERQQRFA